MEILIITGPPYSGKGTQCEFLKTHLGFEHISTGDRCRLEKDNKTDIGLILSKGGLVPDSTMKELLKNILNENRAKKGIILDGYPRTKPQVDDLIELLEGMQVKIGKVVNIEVPGSELLIRAKKRAETSNREDDKDPNTHIRRINVFEEETLPAIAYLQTKTEVLTFDGLGTIEEITEKIKSSL